MKETIEEVGDLEPLLEATDEDVNPEPSMSAVDKRLFGPRSGKDARVRQRPAAGKKPGDMQEEPGALHDQWSWRVCELVPGNPLPMKQISQSDTISVPQASRPVSDRDMLVLSTASRMPADGGNPCRTSGPESKYYGKEFTQSDNTKQHESTAVGLSRCLAPYLRHGLSPLLEVLMDLTTTKGCSGETGWYLGPPRRIRRLRNDGGRDDRGVNGREGVKPTSEAYCVGGLLEDSRTFNQSITAISPFLKLPKSTIGDVAVKYKWEGYQTTTGKPHVLTDRQGQSSSEEGNVVFHCVIPWPKSSAVPLLCS
ncbi:hypothetical protein PR048_013395 [Dryococelus australis]|uniref:Uncharacterized protein n=1 Tax=Dryococelus australis TaxID=614101 RepID=A0ABQ9HSC7_9NEOP|nr:hypothetical protein PR048_013395 [Dryococelus australis]